MYRGWILADLADREVLENLGIVVGEYDKVEGTFENCSVSDEVMEKLDSYWGVFYWGLSFEED